MIFLEQDFFYIICMLVEKWKTGNFDYNACLSQCSEGSWEPHRSDPDSQTLRHTPISSGLGSGRWHSGTPLDHMLGILRRSKSTLSLISSSLTGTTNMMAFSLNLFCGLPGSQSHKHSLHSGDSSEPSEQSMSWSHTKCLGIHCLFWHMNSFSTSQVLLVYTGSGKEHTAVNGCGTVLECFCGFRVLQWQHKADRLSMALFWNCPTYCSRL